MSSKELIIHFELGEIIKIYRERANLSKADVAKELKVTAATISNYEKGRTQLPYKKILKFKKVFGKEFENVLAAIEDGRTDFKSKIRM